LAAGTAHQEVFYFSRAIHKIGYTISLFDTVEYAKFLEKEFERTCDGGERIATSDSSYEEQVVEGFKERIG